MRKAAIIVLTGLALVGPTLLGPGTPAGSPAYAADGAFEPTGVRLPTLEVEDGDDPEDMESQLDDLRAADPGRYRLTLPANFDTATVAAIRKEPTSSLWVTLNTRTPQGEEDYSDEIKLTVATRSGAECASTEMSLPDTAAYYSGPVSVGVLVDPSTMDDTSDEADCMAADTLYVLLAHDPDEDIELPVELTVIEEPSVAGTAQLPEQASAEDFEPSWNPEPEASRVHGARSFQDAPTLRPGRYADKVRSGAVRLYRVDAEWGERVQATVNLSPLTTGEAVQTEGGLAVSVAIYGPGGQRVAANDQKVSAESEVWLGARTPTVHYRNRESSDAGTGAGALSGPYYVVVTAPLSTAIPDLTVSYELDLRTPGKRSGVPAYSGPAAPPNGTLITDDSVSGTAERSALDRADTADSGAERSAGWWPLFGPVAAGLLAAGLVLAVGALWRRRRYRSVTPPTG